MRDIIDETTFVGDARPVVIVLGNFKHEGLTAKIESLGFEVINRQLWSTPANWQRIAKLMGELRVEGRLALVFAYIPTTTLLSMASEKYDAVRPSLVAELERVRSIFFVYEDNLQGTIEPVPWEIDDRDDQLLESLNIPWRPLDHPFDRPTKETWLEEHADGIRRATAFLEDLAERSVELAPFRYRSDVTIRMFEALEDTQAGVFLRLYVPHGRYQSEQFEDFLTLFSRYLRDVEGKEFSVDVHRTARGTAYVFKGRGEASSVDDLRDACKRFDGFLTLSQTDPEVAAKALEQAGTLPVTAGFIVAKYARAARRLQMEIRHEFERRRLILTQSMEAELLDSAESVVLPVPPPGQPSSLFAVIGNAAPVTINIAQGIPAAEAQAQIETLVWGGVRYSAEDRKILELIQSLDDKVEALRLRSELDKLKDSAARPEERQTAVQKLKSFLYKGAKYAGRKADEIGTKVLIAYLERLGSSGTPHT